MKSTVLYRFFSQSDDLLYVGISWSVGSRMASHRRDKPWEQVARIELEHFPSRGEAEAAEVQAIKSESPAWNVVHNDGGPPQKISALPPRPDCWGGWYVTKRPVLEVDCRNCNETFVDRPAVLEYQERFDRGGYEKEGNPAWAREGFLLWLEHDKCGWYEYRHTATKAQVAKWGQMAGGWKTL